MSEPAPAADEATATSVTAVGDRVVEHAVAAHEADPLSNHSGAAAAVGVAAAAAVAPAAAPVRPVYFERQSLSRCAVHTLNNLLQYRAFTPAALDALCRELTPNAFINPHKSLWGVGNYDVNVIMRALQTKGFTVNWFDRRKRQTDSTCEKLCRAVLRFHSLFRARLCVRLVSFAALSLANVRASEVAGLVLNVPSTSFAAFGARHWLTLRPSRPDGQWWKLDSNDKRGPQYVPDVRNTPHVPTDSHRCFRTMESMVRGLMTLLCDSPLCVVTQLEVELARLLPSSDQLSQLLLVLPEAAVAATAVASQQDEHGVTPRAEGGRDTGAAAAAAVAK
jgi:hypothetical protein